jgi:hypothetical protein
MIKYQIIKYNDFSGMGVLLNGKMLVQHAEACADLGDP